MRIYKVETVKDSFVGVSGAPEKVKNHAEKIMDMAMDMRDCVSFVKGEKKNQKDIFNEILISHWIIA